MDSEKIKKIHDFLTEFFVDSEDPISPPGIKDSGLLESAVARPFFSLGDRDFYPSVFHKAAALFHSLIGNHCFFNGNKRTALMSAMVYLADQGRWLSVPKDDDLFEFTRKVAAHEICEKREDEIEFIAQWFKDNSRKRVAGERQLTYRDLKENLERQGFQFGDDDGVCVEIYKDGKFILKVLKKGINGRENYDKKYIGHLRKKLKLTPAYGCDSTMFYGDDYLDSKLSIYLRLREQVMRKLAKI